MNRASELHATQQRVLANEAQAAHTAQQAAIDVANAETRIQFLVNEATQQRLIDEETHGRLAEACQTFSLASKSRRSRKRFRQTDTNEV
jgi:hypothetical protein